MNSQDNKPVSPVKKDSRPEAKTDQQRYFELQQTMAEKTRRVDIALCLVLAVLVFGFSLLGFLLPDQTFSRQENRLLQQLPHLSTPYDGSFIERIKAGKWLDRLFDGSFTEDVSDYMADQFPFRDGFVAVKGVTEIALGKRQNDDVVLGKSQFLLDREDYPDAANLQKNLTAVSRFAEALKERGIPFAAALAGKSEDVVQSVMPLLYPCDRRESLWKQTETAWAELPYLNLRTAFQKSEVPLSELYYRTDHHWTALGAYLAYREIVTAFGDTPYDKSSFTEETASEAFYGTTWSRGGMKWIRPDTMLYYRYDGDEDFVTEIVDTGNILNGFYDRSYLSEKDQYSSFLSGNNALVRIRKQGSEENRPRMLVIKDSFAHSAAPLLARHYDLDLIDPRYYRDYILTYIEENGIDRVLLLCNMESMTDTSSLVLLAAGLNAAEK